MRKIVSLLLMICVFLSIYGNTRDSLELENLNAEVNDLKATIYSLKKEDARLKGLCRQQITEISFMRLAYQKQAAILDSLKTLQQQQSENLKILVEKVGTDISYANQKIDNNVNTLSESINSRTWFGALGILIAIGLLACAYYVLRRKISSGATTIDKIRSAQEGLETAQKAMQEESVKLDSKLVELLDKKVEATPIPIANEQADHTLALKVADEIVRIETNLSRMDTSVKGYKQLAKAVERIRTNFLANGYEIVEMLGKPYNEGMKVVANFVSDDTLAEGEQKITGIIKPQINYKGKMIQSAQITVSQNL